VYRGVKKNKTPQCLQVVRGMGDTLGNTRVKLKMRLSLSQKEVAEIHLMLTTLPIPPMPVGLTMQYGLLEDTEEKAAFEMATSTLVKDSLADDGIVNSHSIFAALSFFAKWSASTGTDPLQKHTDMQLKKDASLLRFIKSVLDYNETAASCASTDAKDAAILQLFITASQEWINTYLPQHIRITIHPAPKNKDIGFEHDLHIAMAHYCYSQGVLYNSKDSVLMCKVHDGLYSDFLEQQKKTAEDSAAGEDVLEKTHEHMEIAAMYSQFPYHKMMQLCFDRLLQDCLYGHKNPNADCDVQQNARDLLKMSFANYKAMTNKSVCVEPQHSTTCTPASSAQTYEIPVAMPFVCVESASDTVSVGKSAAPAEVESASDTVSVGKSAAPAEVESASDTVSVGKSAAPAEVESASDTVSVGKSAAPAEVESGCDSLYVTSPMSSGSAMRVRRELPSIMDPEVVKKSCVADMGSYKSSIGIFILGMANFLQKDDPYCMQNINTSLRHLSELMRHGNAHAKQACGLIDIPRLTELVRLNITGLSYDNTMAEIKQSLLEIEQMHLTLIHADTTAALEACPTTVL